MQHAPAGALADDELIVMLLRRVDSTNIRSCHGGPVTSAEVLTVVIETDGPCVIESRASIRVCVCVCECVSVCAVSHMCTDVEMASTAQDKRVISFKQRTEEGEGYEEEGEDEGE